MAVNYWRKAKQIDRIKEFFSDLVQVVWPIGLPEVCIHKNTVYEKKLKQFATRCIFLSTNSSKRKLKHNFINSFHLNYRKDSVKRNTFCFGSGIMVKGLNFNSLTVFPKTLQETCKQ